MVDSTWEDTQRDAEWLLWMQEAARIKSEDLEIMAEYVKKFRM